MRDCFHRCTVFKLCVVVLDLWILFDMVMMWVEVLSVGARD